MTAFSSSINLPNIKVTDQETLDNGDIIVRVECLENGTHCKCCGKHITKRHSINSRFAHFAAYLPGLHRQRLINCSRGAQ